ncbi:unnamed protein product [Discula destructiva]
MAPIDPDHNAVERQLKQIIQILYETMIQVNTYDAHTTVSNGASTPSRLSNPSSTTTTTQQPTRDVLAAQLAQLSAALQDIHQLAAHSAASPHSASALSAANIPRELIQYVENGRNPDIYTREFVELVRRENQLMKGKMAAFAGFRDVLAREMASACPELYEDLSRVVVGTGGVPPPAS